MAMSKQEREIIQQLQDYVTSERDSFVELIKRQNNMLERMKERCLQQQSEIEALKAPKPKLKPEHLDEWDLSKPIEIWWDDKEQRFCRIDPRTKQLMVKKKSYNYNENWYAWKQPFDRPILVRRIEELTKREGGKTVIHSFTEPKNEAKTYREVFNAWKWVSRLHDLNLISLEEWDTFRKKHRKEIGME